MTQREQLAGFIELLQKLVENQQHYTLTGAADWPILAAIGGLMSVIFIAMVAAMWNDLRTIIRDNRIDWKAALKEHKDAHQSDIDHIWAGMRDCKEDCCPARKKD